MGHGGWPLVKLSREGSCLGDARRMLLFMVEQVFLLIRRFGECVTQIHNP